MIRAFLLAFLLTSAAQQTDFDLLLERARRALAAGQLDEAAAHTAAAGRLQPRSAPLHFLLAELSEARDDSAAAVAAWREVIRLAPDEPGGYLRLASLESRLGRAAAALEVVEQLIDKKPDVVEAYRVAGQIAAETGQLRLAEQRLRQLVERSPSDAEGWNLLGVVLSSGPGKAQAEAAFRKALEEQPDLADAHYNLGLLLAEKGDLAAAERSLTQAARLQPDRAQVHYALGTTRRRREDISKAEASLRAALQLQPEYPEALYALAGVLRETGRVEEARALLERYQAGSRRRLSARETGSRIGSLHSEVRLKLADNDLDGAAALVEQILEAAPDDALAHYRKGQIAYLQGDMEEALASARQARQLQGAEPAFANLEAMSLAALRRVDEAVAAYQIVIELSDDADAYIAAAQLLGRNRRLAEGIALLEEGLARRPGNRKLGLALVAALEASGDGAAAAAKRRELGLPPA